MSNARHWKTASLRSRLGVGVAVVALCWAADPNEVRISSSAYFPISKNAITVDTKLVEVGAVVRDGRGHSIGGLTRDDFEISDNGKKRAITAFSVETFQPSGLSGAGGTSAAPVGVAPAAAKTPRYVALVFDDMGLGVEETIRSKAAALRFIKEGFGPNDRAGVFTTSQQHNLPFTTDPAKVAEAIEHIAYHPRTTGAGLCPHYTPYDAYVIANNLDRDSLAVKVSEYLTCHPSPGGGSKRGRSADSLDPNAVRDVMAETSTLWEEIRMNSLNTMGSLRDLIDYMVKLDGKRVMLIASSGFITGTLEQEEDALVTHALHAGVVINSIDARGLYTQAPLEMSGGANVRSAIRQGTLGTRPEQTAGDVLGTLAESTGGLFFHNNNDLTLGFRELGMVPEVSYLMAFAPDAPDGRFHKLKVRVKAKGEVQARPGYMSLAAAKQAAREERTIDREATGQDERNDLPVTFAAASGKLEGGGAAVQVTMHLDVSKLKFREAFGFHSQKLRMITALFDGSGNYVKGAETVIDLELTDATYKQASEGGANFRVTLEAPPGEYRLRGVVEESLEGKITASAKPITVK